MISTAGLAVLAALVFVPFAIVYVWRVRFSLTRSLASILMALYLAVVVGVTLGPLPVGGGFDNDFGGAGSSVNLIPFRTIARYFAEGVPLGLAIRQVGGNLLLFLPLGFLLPVIGDRIRSVGWVAGAALVVSVTIELSQAIVILTLGNAARALDIDDVILNIAGAVLGWAFWRLVTMIGSRPV